jgi:protein-S-isoprenylcysteine O-methyltransferase Ste14
MSVALLILAYEAFLAAVLFISAGRSDLPWFWAAMGVHAVMMTIGYSSIGPDLLRERMKPAPGGKDRRLRLFAMPFVLTHLIVAGLDVGRFHWSGEMPFALHAAGLAGFALSLSLAIWAMRVNRFFSPVARIQQERGHHVITAGPYRFVRHPGYLGAILSMFFGGVALGSWWSLLPLTPMVGLLLRRTIVEDRLLRAELPGYADYAKRVRYRLLPGVW